MVGYRATAWLLVFLSSNILATLSGVSRLGWAKGGVDKVRTETSVSVAYQTQLTACSNIWFWRIGIIILS